MPLKCKCRTPMILAYGDIGVRRVIRVCPKCRTVAMYYRPLYAGEKFSRTVWTPELTKAERRLVARALGRARCVSPNR